MNKRLLSVTAAFALFGMAFAQTAPSAQSGQIRRIVETPEMQITASDIFLQKRAGAEGGVDLFIRKKPAVNSIMLVETTSDPSGKATNYAYRAGKFNEVNGNEIRYLNGQELNSEYSRFSLIDSTTEMHPVLGESFHIYIPETIYYGYPWSRNGEVKIGRGTFINIRTFTKPYGDYTGRYMDNAFMFDLGKKPPKKKVVVKKPKPAPVPVPEPVVEVIPEPVVEPEVFEEPEPEPEVEPEPEFILTDDYNAVAAESFAGIAKDGNGLLYYSTVEKLTEDLLASVDRIMPHTKVDVVFAIDTTGSMKDDLDQLKKEWVPKLLEQVLEFEDIRLGLLFYRDFNDTYNYKGMPVKVFDFTRSTDQFKKNLNTVLIHGNEGGDIPEAVYEALYSSMVYYEWREDAQKKIILIGDAEPHPFPRGPKKISRETVMDLAKQKNVTLDCIIVPDKKK